MDRRMTFSMNMARVCIDGFDTDLSGRVYSKQSRTPLRFSGYCGMLLQMDDMFDRTGYPEAFHETRSFRARPFSGSARAALMEQADDEELQRQSGSRATFDLIVQSRRRSGWQGILMCPERLRGIRFRSELELLACICGEMGEAVRECVPAQALAAWQLETVQEEDVRGGVPAQAPAVWRSETAQQVDVRTPEDDPAGQTEKGGKNDQKRQIFVQKEDAAGALADARGGAAVCVVRDADAGGGGAGDPLGGGAGG